MDEKSKSFTISVSITAEARDRLREIAKENHVTVSAQIARWIWDYKLKSEIEQEKQ